MAASAAGARGRSYDAVVSVDSFGDLHRMNTDVIMKGSAAQSQVQNIYYCLKLV